LGAVQEGNGASRRVRAVALIAACTRLGEAALDFYEGINLNHLFEGDGEEARRGRGVLGEENEDALPPGPHLGPRRGRRYRTSHEVGNAVAIQFAAKIDVPFVISPEVTEKLKAVHDIVRSQAIARS
jgi:hypothetical protein